MSMNPTDALMLSNVLIRAATFGFYSFAEEFKKHGHRIQLYVVLITLLSTTVTALVNML